MVCVCVCSQIVHHSADIFQKREFSFTIGGDVYIRYKSFRDADEFALVVREMMPEKIDIGAVYNIMPRNHASVASGKFYPVLREFVVDIDFSDYNDVWSLGRGSAGEDGGGALVNAEWPVMSAAVQCLTRLLTECFGFEDIMWVYSGRRGVHGWICDPEARALSNEARSAVADFLQVLLVHRCDWWCLYSYLLSPRNPRCTRVVIRAPRRCAWAPASACIRSSARSTATSCCRYSSTWPTTKAGSRRPRRASTFWTCVLSMVSLRVRLLSLSLSVCLSLSLSLPVSASLSACLSMSLSLSLCHTHSLCSLSLTLCLLSLCQSATVRVVSPSQRHECRLVSCACADHPHVSLSLSLCLFRCTPRRCRPHQQLVQLVPTLLVIRLSLSLSASRIHFQSSSCSSLS